MDNFNFELYSLVLQWAIIFLAFNYLSKREGGFLNIATPAFLIFSFQYYYFDIWGIIRGNTWVGNGGFNFVTWLNTFQFSFYLIGVALGSSKFSLIPTGRGASSKSYIEPCVLILLAFIVFSPIIAKFGSLVITNPRLVYTQTRTGWGPSYFMSAFFIYMSLGFLLFNVKPNRVNAVLIIAAYTTLLAFFGSKGKILGAWFMVYFWYIFHKPIKVRVLRFILVLSLSIPSAAIIIDKFTVREGQTLSFAEKIDFASRYADYNKNQAMVFVSDKSFEGRSLVLEDYIVSKIPRFFYHNKPKSFGEFSLAEEFYPSWFMEDNGSPRFGNAIFFVDMGYWAFPFIVFSSLLSGCLAGSLWMGFKSNPNAYNFIIFTIFNGVVYLSAGAGSFATETIVFVLILYSLRYLKIPIPSLKRLR